MTYPYPPGQETGTVADADNAHAGNVVSVAVKVPGSEMSRIWADDLPGLPPWAPVASFTYSPAAPSPSTVVTFDGSSSTPGGLDTPVTGYAWTFGDGSTGTGVTATWKLPAGHGSWTVTLTVTAADGQTGSTAQVITV